MGRSIRSIVPSMTGTNRLRKFRKTLPYNLALLGLMVLVLSVANHLLLDGAPAKHWLESPPPLTNDTGRQLVTLQERLRVRPDEQRSYVKLGAAYLQKARETGDLSYYIKTEDAALKALELAPSDVGAMVLLGTIAATSS